MIMHVLGKFCMMMYEILTAVLSAAILTRCRQSSHMQCNATIWTIYDCFASKPLNETVVLGWYNLVRYYAARLTQAASPHYATLTSRDPARTAYMTRTENFQGRGSSPES